MRRAVLALIGLTALAGGIVTDAGPASATGEGRVVLSGAPAPNSGTHRPIDVTGDSADRLWFASLDRVVPVGSAADATCGGDADGHACGRMGRVSPNGSVRYFTGPGNLMESPIAVDTFGQTAFAADSTAHTIWRVRNSDTRASEVMPVYQHQVIAPTELLVRGTTVWFAGSADTDRSIAGDTAERIGRIGRFDVRNPSGTIKVFAVPRLRDIAGLTFDANGRLWFSGNGIRRQRPPAGPAGDVDVGIGFGRLNPLAQNPAASIQTFTQSQFTGGSFPSAPSEMITGPDDRIWFVDNGTSQIGRFSPGNPLGTFEFMFAACDGLGAPPPPDPDGHFRCGGRLFDLVRGPDGAVWYSRTRESLMGRIEVGGAVTSMAPAIQDFAEPWALARQSASSGHPARIVVTMPGASAIGWFVP